MTRDRAIAAAEAYFDEGGFAEDLARRVAIPSESQVERGWRTTSTARSRRACSASALRPRRLPTRPALARC